ncbi:MAG: outer membrane protein assembly factor BamD, partial [Candidatus Latescibacteria bacterium]|nr:outer membrane protein assembly factor BamD [Candidatus Latescibacterota bacterium]
MKREETKLAVVLVALLVALSGCVYYNTFFNAERAYSDAEAARLRQSADGGSKTTRSSSTRRYNTTDYDRAIDKASRVLAFYPESDYVDDALVMLAKAFYWKREYANTIRKADELAANLPDSPLIPESLYWKALAIWRQGDAPKAKEMLDILRGRADDDLASQASYSLGQLAFEERRYSDSIIFYQEVLSRTKDEEQALEARGRIGYAWIELGDPRRAIPIFADLADNAVTYSARYNALTNLARAQRDLGNPEAALATLDGLEQDERFSDRIPETRVEIAHTHELGGDTSQAILLYQEIIDDAEFARSAATRQATRRDEDDGPQPAPTAEAGVAHFRLGRIRQDRFGDLWTARDHYQSAATGPSSPGDSTKIKAQKLVANIDRLGDLRDQLADTVGVPDTAATWFSIAEHLYLSMSMHDSALAYYDSVATRYPVHTLTPRSRYAAAWLTEHEIGDSVRSATMIDALLKDTTSSAAAIYVRRAIRR